MLISRAQNLLIKGPTSFPPDISKYLHKIIPANIYCHFIQKYLRAKLYQKTRSNIHLFNYFNTKTTFRISAVPLFPRILFLFPSSFFQPSRRISFLRYQSDGRAPCSILLRVAFHAPQLFLKNVDNNNDRKFKQRINYQSFSTAFL